MAARVGYNKNSSAVKRIMQEAKELAKDPSTDYTAAPLEDDIFEWHCTIRGPSGTEFEGGLYHFRILLPSEYPFRPPSIMVLTPNGRFELNTKICISFTNYHEELWQPAWGVRTAIIGLQGFFPLKGTAAVGVGALEYPAVERKRLAALSRDWVCPTCKVPNKECLPDSPDDVTSHAVTSGPDVPPSLSDLGASAPSAPETVERAFNVLDAATATTIADPPLPTPPNITIHTPPLVAPKPIRPIDSASIIIPASPPRLASPLPPVAPPPASSFPAPQTPQLAVSAPASRSHTPSLRTLPNAMRRLPRRPPIILDTAICVLLVAVFALICRRVL